MRRTVLTALLALSTTTHASGNGTPAEDGVRHRIKSCEEAALLVTTAFVRFPVDAPSRSQFINEEKARILVDRPDVAVEDKYLMSAMAAVIFHLVEMELLNSDAAVSPELQLRLASRAGAACAATTASPRET